jgi:hypothetical protein
MGNFEIVSSTLNINFTFNNENVSINGSAQKDGKTCVMQTLSGACYTPNEGGDGEFIGNFNGHRRDGKMLYSLSDIAPADAQTVADAIAEIEDIINKS